MLARTTGIVPKSRRLPSGSQPRERRPHAQLLRKIEVAQRLGCLQVVLHKLVLLQLAVAGRVRLGEDGLLYRDGVLVLRLGECEELVHLEHAVVVDVAPVEGAAQERASVHRRPLHRHRQPHRRLPLLELRVAQALARFQVEVDEVAEVHGIMLQVHGAVLALARRLRQREDQQRAIERGTRPRRSEDLTGHCATTPSIRIGKESLDFRVNELCVLRSSARQQGRELGQRHAIRHRLAIDPEGVNQRLLRRGGHAHSSSRRPPLVRQQISPKFRE
eukprot:scaffold33174_cov71-Phaeocystis_antarctica.AAC.2